MEAADDMHLCVQAWNSWLDYTEYSKAKKGAMRGALLRILRYKTAASWQAWADFVGSRKAAKAQVSWRPPARHAVHFQMTC
jgi:hypothetical protein